MTDSEEFRCACNILSFLGVTSNYTGFYQTAYAITLAVHDPEKLQMLGKQLYPDVAERYNTGPFCVERNIRMIRTLCWEKSPHLMVQIAGHPLARRPGNARFLAILAKYIASGGDPVV